MSISHKTVGIEVDDRASASPVLAALREYADFHVTVARLSLGDYLVDGRFLFERKTLTDLVGRSRTAGCFVRRCNYRPG
jgi:ERCC4-type nuclease